MTAVPPVRRPLDELSGTEQTALLDFSLEEELRELARAGTPEWRDEDGVAWVWGAIPGAIVYRTDLPAASADARIRDLTGSLNGRGLDVTWWARPEARPTDLRDRLVRHGFELTDDEAGMVADLDALIEDLPRPAGLQFEVFGQEDRLDPAAVDAWLEVAGTTFVWLPERYDIRRALYHGDARRPRPWRHVVGWLDGRPVAMARVLLGDGLAMVHGVATVPDVRRRGIGSAVTVAALQQARVEGCRIGVLQASSMGQGPYARIGFRTIARYGRYERAAATGTPG